MITIRSMTIDDYDAVIELMRSTPGISIRDADSRESTVRYLARNPDMSFVAEAEGALCGCVMSGHDGRRGYLQHLIVLPEYRRQGIARELVERCLECLEAQGIYKCHLDVLKGNEAAGHYWRAQGWTLREDIDRYSRVWRGGRDA
ncbi:GNAT family N-acetyltransferase [Pseudomonas syringae]|uniref:GNAT family N-acetyltransferase n=1 Tax=Pseudomonas syringae TaxID=317 RepID=UPI001EED874E|nr:GNAT family N-acetyltransferase [Pseudomonas syringae]MBL3830651.1 GNAT family N-acetyltransferase [Pseudomonas syringae pv. theae]MBL3833484.1 GNAT family N-acetyltransferase [Pseudomonas syringae pv. theae]MBL3867407.1 GNAT family N-acetyltransferase [Pseudomonas syringae pv. theae]GKQ45506.1 GNAT family N-acetyltransferase [Pseudomonas syringae pv. theae]